MSDRQTAGGWLAVLVCLMLASGCALGMRSTYPADAPARTASDTPARFMIGSATGETSEPRPGDGCRNPMIDPRDGMRLTLVLSQRGPEGEIGDYEVPGRRYGVRAGELLRLDCSSGRVVGIVPDSR